MSALHALRSSSALSPRGLALSGALALVLTLAPAAGAGVMSETFRALPKDQRVEVQRELARADLFFGPVDGDWNAATEMALQRSVEEIALKSNDRLHPKPSSPQTARAFLGDLGDGTYSRLLYGGSLIERLFFLSTDPVSEIERIKLERAAE